MSGLRVIEQVNQKLAAPGFLVAFVDDDGNQVYADYNPVEGSPHYAAWPHSLWGWFETREAASDAIRVAGLREMD